MAVLNNKVFHFTLLDNISDVRCNSGAILPLGEVLEWHLTDCIENIDLVVGAQQVEHFGYFLLDFLKSCLRFACCIHGNDLGNFLTGIEHFVV